MTETKSYFIPSALFTDLYELTMAQAYDSEGMNETAVFELFFRNMPNERNYMIAAGLNDVLEFLDEFHFDGSDIDYLREQPQFSNHFLERLRETRFTGNVSAMREGTIVYPNEPILQIIAPIFEAQIIETFLLNQVHYQSLAFTKAARVVTAARGRTVVDFGSRRAHGTDAALKVARATYLAGGEGTSNVLAGKLYGLPIFGTMAHSYIQAHDAEYDTFQKFAELYPNTTLLVDTYDTLQGVQKVIDVLKTHPALKVGAIRLDSGDLIELSNATRDMLDRAGFEDIKIFLSSGLDEYSIDKLLDAGAPIDGFGVGTKLVVSEDVPYLDFAYKLVEYAGIPRIKLSSEKEIFPGQKQIYRDFEEGLMVRDVITREDETHKGLPLLQPMMRNGERLTFSHFSNEDIRNYIQHELESLPEDLRNINKTAHAYPVEVSENLQQDLESIKNTLQHTI